MNKKIIKRSFLIGLVVLILLSIFFQANAGKLSIDIDKLNMSDTEIPKDFSCDWYEKIFEWEYTEIIDERWIEYYAVNPDEKIRIFQWSEEDEGGVIQLAIVDYKHPITARINYFLLDPSRRRKEYYSNFENKIKLVLANGTWINKVADQATFQCGTGTEEKCYNWFYRARYGQYYLQIEANGPTCYQYFEQVVANINNQFITNIETKK